MMGKDKFNRYCAEVVDIDIATTNHPDDDRKWFYNINSRVEFNPYDDLNQMAEVVEKLCFKTSKRWIDTGNYLYPNEIGITDLVEKIRDGKPIKQALRDFIISTMPETDK